MEVDSYPLSWLAGVYELIDAFVVLVTDEMDLAPHFDA
jgi:hypothetical protein